MEMNHLILLFLPISISCLFSFSTCTTTFSYHISPSSYSYTMTSFESSSSPLSPLDAQSLTFLEPQEDQTFSQLPANVDPRLQRICGETDHPVECMTTITPFLGPKVDIEPLSILKLEVQAMENKANEALDKASRILQDRSTRKLVASCLETCMESYRGIIDSCKRVLDAISIHDANQLSMELNSNIENVQACDDAFLESGIDSPIMEMDSLLGKMIHNSLAIGLYKVHF